MPYTRKPLAPKGGQNSGVVSLHLVGDTHYGAIPYRRRQVVLNDLYRLPKADRRIHMGDSADTGLASQIANAKAFYDSFSDGVPYEVLIGNHDLAGSGTVQQWLDNLGTSLGYTSQNWTRDLGKVKLIGIGPSVMDGVETWSIHLQQSALDFLDRELGNTSKDCIVCCHAPPYNSVIAAVGGSSEKSGWYAEPQGAAEAVIANHANAIAWVSGHTHTDPMISTTLAVGKTYGSHKVACVNASALYYLGVNEGWDQVVSCFMDYYDGSDGNGKRVEVRFRDHGAGIWFGPDAATRVYTVTL